jgi:hypothetical protein
VKILIATIKKRRESLPPLFAAGFRVHLVPRERAVILSREMIHA